MSCALSATLFVSGLQQGDLGVIDIDFARKDTNEPIPGMKQEKFAYDTDMQDGLSKKPAVPSICLYLLILVNLLFTTNIPLYPLTSLPKPSRALHAAV